jgi:cell division protein FtsQ
VAQWQQQYPKLASVDLRYDREVVLKMAADPAPSIAPKTTPKPEPKPAHTTPQPAAHKAPVQHTIPHQNKPAQHTPPAKSHSSPPPHARPGAA